MLACIPRNPVAWFTSSIVSYILILFLLHCTLSLLLSPVGMRSIAMSVSVCLSVRLSVCPLAYPKDDSWNFTKFYVRVKSDRQCNTLCTSGWLTGRIVKVLPGAALRASVIALFSSQCSVNIFLCKFSGSKRSARGARTDGSAGKSVNKYSLYSTSDKYHSLYYAPLSCCTVIYHCLNASHATVILHIYNTDCFMFLTCKCLWLV